jgi:hypothetical protein
MSKLDPTQTIIHLPEDVPWKVPEGTPAESVEEATLSGSENEDGIYPVLMKWYPGWMSARTSIAPTVSASSSRACGGATVVRTSIPTKRFRHIRDRSFDELRGHLTMTAPAPTRPSRLSSPLPVSGPSIRPGSTRHNRPA